MSRSEHIAELVKAINECWRKGRYEDLRGYFHPDMVLAPPGLEMRISGVDAVIDSYRDYGEHATTHAFDAEEPRVDVLGRTAVATTAFTVDYEFQGQRSRESGVDILVFTEEADGWRVRWRTLVAEAS